MAASENENVQPENVQPSPRDGTHNANARSAAVPQGGETVINEPAADAKLFSAGFIGLVATQFLTAVNDNTFRWLVIGVGKTVMPPEQHGQVLMLGTVSFVLPYLLFSVHAGFLADRFNKARVILACKIAEILIMLFGFLAILWVPGFSFGGLPVQLWILFGLTFLMGAQSALFAPAKMGAIPELLPTGKLSAANGVLGLCTVVAIIVGMAAGNILSDATGGGQSQSWLIAAVLLGTAGVGTVTSLFITGLIAANPVRKFPWNPLTSWLGDFGKLFGRAALTRVAFGMVFFWSVGALAQLNVDQFVTEGTVAGAKQLQSNNIPLLVCLVMGLGVGSLLAGIWSADRVELGLLPMGAGGVALFSMLLFTVGNALVVEAAASLLVGFTWQYVFACVLLGMLGVSAGLFNVPLEAYMQDRSPAKDRGSIWAATNALIFAGILLSAVAFNIMRMPIGSGKLAHPLLTSKQVFLVAGLLTIPILFYILWLLPQATIRFIVWLISQTFYRLRVHGRENIPKEGPALLTANHVSWLDGFIIMLTVTRPIRVIAHGMNLRKGWIAKLAKMYNVIVIDHRPSSIRAALSEAREALKNGELVCIFPEGGITRTGQLLAFRPGLMRILKGTSAPVVPIYLDELWGSIFSFSKGKFFWKWPTHWPHPISLFFGKPLDDVRQPHEVRQAVQELGAVAVQHRDKQYELPCTSFLRTCKKKLFKRKLSDSTGRELTGGKVLAATLAMRRLLANKLLDKDEKNVGVLLPPSVPACVVNVALALDRRVSVNVNYTVSSDVANFCLAEAEVKHVLTSRKFMEKIDLQLEGVEIVYLEDLADQVSKWDKFVCGLAAYTLPASMLASRFGLADIKGDDPLTIIFTSGSTGMPKGVVLTHNNIAHNVTGIEQVVRLHSNDVMLGLLPFFHSFGYTVTMWGPAAIDIAGVYHFNPLDAKQVGKLSEKYGVTILLATPTFLRGYVRRCTPEQFSTLDVAVVGAEKMPIDLADAFEEKFGFRPAEGYGTTELSPLVSVNVPSSRQSDNFQIQAKEGTVGRPFPAVTAKITDVDSGETLGVGEDGMLWIKGPNVMRGYLNRDDATAEVIRDEWYKTGDVAHIDDDGFIKITGRMSRFSKIGGEMVPHVRVEEEISKLLPPPEDADDHSSQAAVTSVACPKKGERLVVIHKPLSVSVDAICQGLRDSGLPNIFIPAADSFFETDEIPLLGSGKLDLRRLKEVAEEKTAVAT